MPNRKSTNGKICTTGTISELKAQIWLLNQGYEVFTNVRPSGKADILAWDLKANHVLKIDVKTVRIYKKADGTKSYIFSGLGTVGFDAADRKTTENVVYLGYCEEEDMCLWY